MSKHTPGPWNIRAVKDGQGRYPDGSYRPSIRYRIGVPASDGLRYSADISSTAVFVADCGENAANAALIAAAPEMLTALRLAVADDSTTSHVWDACNKALARAEGRS